MWEGALDWIITRAPEASLSSIFITCSSSRAESLFDGLLSGEGSVILLLLPFDELANNALELSALSEEILALSERGDLIDSLRGCLAIEALINRGMHFDRPFSLSPAESNGLSDRPAL